VPADEPTDRGLRIKHLITGGKDVTEFSPLPATLWWTILQEWGLAIDRTVDVGQAITGVPSETGHALLNATMKLGSDEEAFPDSDQFDPTPNLYLLPCRQLMSETEGSHSSPDIDKNHVQLVNVESHESRENNHRQVLRPENTAITEIAPPAETGFALYSLSKEAFENHGGSITEAPWGTRNYGGSADLYRTLLKDIADRSTEVTLADIQFLETVYERINFEEATIDLYPLEGGYHARDQVKKLATSRNSVDKLKTRNDVRRVTAPSKLVEGTEETLAQDIRFDDHLLRYWNSTNVAVEHENEESAETSTESATDQPLPPIETNGPQTHLPADIKGQLDENIETENNLVTQLGMLGVSVLPGVRTLLIRGDEAHPDRHENLSWDPTEWKTTNSDRVKNLQTLLDTQNGEMYLDLLTTPPFGPGESSYHTKHCDVKQYPRKESSLRDELSNYEVMLTSWVWLSPTTCEEIIASDLADLLSEYGDKFAESIFATGWSCNHGWW